MISLFMMMRNFLFMMMHLWLHLFHINKKDALLKPPQIITTNTLSNIKLPVLQKDDYDTWAMEMEHYLEPERLLMKKNGKLRTLLLMACSKRSSQSFHAMDDAKEFWAAIKTSWMPLGAKLCLRKKQITVLRSLPPAWDSLAMTMRTKGNIEHTVIDDYTINLSQAYAMSQLRSFRSYTTSSSKATPTATPGLADEVIHSFLATNADDVDLIHEDLTKLNDLIWKDGIYWQHCYDCIKIKKFSIRCRECKFKGTKDGSRQEASRGQDFKPVRTEKEALMTIDEGQINWVEQTTDEEINHALMAFTVNNEGIIVGLGYGIKSNAEVLGYEEEISRGIFASRETDAGYNDIPLYSRFKQVEYKGVPHPLSGDYTPREQEDIDDSLYVYGKYGPQPQSPSPTVSNVSSISFSICPSNDSDGELGTVSGASSTHYSTCQSNDSDGELGTVTDHSVNDDLIHDQTPIPSIEQVTIATQKTQPQVPKPTQTVDPSCAQHVKSPRQPIRTPVTSSPIPSNNRQNWNQRMNRDLGAGYSFERKPCYVCGSLSHLIKDCDYYEKKMAREAALKSKRVVHTNDRQATPAWNNTNRVNKANQFNPRPVNVRPNLSTASNTIKTGRVNVNTGNGNVNSASVHVNAGTQVKSGTSRFNTGKRYFNSGCDHINTARVNRP
ncbi:putative ribonuclease H-like domain-containing protein, partial [Tanacetum coccineum]